MIKSCASTLSESSVVEKKPYEPSKVELVLFKDDVVRTSSSFTTNGFYDDLGDWDVFDKGI